MSRFWSDVTARLKPYVPGEQPVEGSFLKLNTNESPYPPSPNVNSAVSDFSISNLSLYPDPDSRMLVDALSERFNLSNENIFVGNGSDEVLAHIFVGLLRQGRPLRFPDISYGFYSVWAELFDIKTKLIPLRQDFSINVEDYLDTDAPIIIANPNAPTSLALELDDIERLASGNPDSVVVIDEAYIDYGGESALPLVEKYENILVVQTFSKSRALAGTRVGYALGHPALIQGLRRVKDSFNSYPVDSFSQATAVASLSDEDYFRKCCDRICSSRESLIEGLDNLGFDVLPSKTNFVFASHPDISGAELYGELYKRKILVRYWDTPRLQNHVRITVGSENQCRQLLSELGKIVL